MLSSSGSSVSANLKESVNRGVNKIDYTSKLNINEPSSLIPIPIYRLLDYTGEIVNDCDSFIVCSLNVLKNVKHDLHR